MTDRRRHFVQWKKTGFYSQNNMQPWDEKVWQGALYNSQTLSKTYRWAGGERWCRSSWSDRPCWLITDQSWCWCRRVSHERSSPILQQEHQDKNTSTNFITKASKEIVTGTRYWTAGSDSVLLEELFLQQHFFTQQQQPINTSNISMKPMM